MPSRKLHFINNKIYHVYDKTVDGKKVLLKPSDCTQFYNLLLYYRSNKSNISYSFYNNVLGIRETLEKEISDPKNYRIEVLSYCLMPNHFHLLLKQVTDNGIIDFMSKVKNAYTKHYNKINLRFGPLFIGQFKANIIRNENHLLHISRYIHLNPYSSSFVKNPQELRAFEWSSYPSYVDEGVRDYLVSLDEILGKFNFSRKEYESFVIDRARVQKSLEDLKRNISL